MPPSPLGGALAFLVLLLAVCGTVLAVVLVGLPLLAVLALAGVPFAALERRRLLLVDPVPVPDPHRDPDRTGLTAWARTRFREQATWRELGYVLLAATVLWPLELLAVGAALYVPADLIATPVLLALDGQQANPLSFHGVTGYPAALLCAAAGLLLLPLFLYGLGVLAAVRAALARLMLSPGRADLAVRVTELTSSRARLAAAFDAERRRIERDLHDGAQQRLVALSMTLGLARLDAPPGSARPGPACPCSSSPSTCSARTPPNCSTPATGRPSATCSRTGSARSRSSSTRSPGWRPAGRWSTPRSYAASSAAGPIRWSG